eukprot:CAMPEP_0178987184 /NCGR_PEP_ID=MMETSP0795-20121207/3124_1 /TAXON_ID=88552 /ORGANISM="Amoebophrya sp., Strain Ameob2" /LENGTH=305 /DNA_ID=CAMNT_0020678339 /DNA_START=422 /DNA_END=1338 /DNA_ORIENTATION=+
MVHMDDLEVETPHSFTGRMCAGSRYEEHTRKDRLFTDPQAFALAGSSGRRQPMGAWILVPRTKFGDDLLVERYHNHGARQLVLLGAGMDSRAFRLPGLPELKVFEVDQQTTFDVKEPILKALRDEKTTTTGEGPEGQSSPQNNGGAAGAVAAHGRDGLLGPGAVGGAVDRGARVRREGADGVAAGGTYDVPVAQGRPEADAGHRAAVGAEVGGVPRRVQQAIHHGRDRGGGRTLYRRERRLRAGVEDERRVRGVPGARLLRRHQGGPEPEKPPAKVAAERKSHARPLPRKSDGALRSGGEVMVHL